MISLVGRVLGGALLVATVLPTNSAFYAPSALAQTNDLNALHELYKKSFRAGDYAMAEQLAKRMLDITEERFGKDHQDYAKRLEDLAGVYGAQNRFAAAELLYKQVLEIREKKLGPKHSHVAVALINVASVYHYQGKHAEAIQLYEQALAIFKPILESTDPHIANVLQQLATVYHDQGKHAEATRLLKRALEIQEMKLGRTHTKYAVTLMSLSNVYYSRGRFAEAIPLYERALAIFEMNLGRTDQHVAVTLINLANVYQFQGRHAEAIPLYERALAILEKKLGRTHPYVADALVNLAILYQFQGRHAEAKSLCKRALAIWEEKLGRTHPKVANALSCLATVYRNQGGYVEALPLYKRALVNHEKNLGRMHRRVAATLNHLAHLYLRQDQYRVAFSYARRAAEILAESRQRAAIARVAENGERKEPLSHINRDLVQIAYGFAQEEPSQRYLLADGALAAAQRYGTTSVSMALSQMAARLGVGDRGLGQLVREQQDLGTRWQSLDKKLIKALSQPPGKRNDGAETKLRQELVAVEARIKELFARLQKDYPQYGELTNPEPLNVAEVQRLLGPDEALVSYLVLEKATYVWAVTRNAVAWKQIEQQKNDVEQQIAILRRSLDPVAALTEGGRGLSREQVCRGLERQGRPCEDYDTDLARAHRLYQTLLGPVAGTIEGKRHLIVVPTGPLTGLPFHMLVIDPPPHEGKLEERFKKAQWLIRRHAVTVLPSVSSLRALRVLATKGLAKRPFIGFGDPDFSKPAKKTRDRKRTRTARATRGYAAYFRGKLADVDSLSGAIPQLPDTADELRAVARVFKARKSEIVLGRRASESTIKDLNRKGTLDDYRIVHFATHGLVAGEIKGLAEPALAFSLPAEATEKDDGLLTASEVAQLKLNADWVVLSACNTAAGEKPGAEALSGLARAFFYSGTRALLVSHWPVVSEAAVKLTTTTFAELKANPGIGRAEALRRSMLALIDKGAPYQAHPAYWAPFIVVGEGGRPSS